MRTPAHPGILPLVIALSVGGTSQAQSPRDPSTDERAIRGVEDRIEAATGRNDADALARLWAPDYMFVNPAGQLLSRDRRLEMFRSGEMRVERYTRDQETIRIYGSTAIVFYRSTVAAARRGTDLSSQRRVTTVLVNRHDQWEAVSQQSSIIQAAATAAAIEPLHVAVDPPPAGNEEAAVRDVEQRIAEATANDDAGSLEHWWSPEFVWIGPIGQLLTRAQRLQMIRSGQVASERYTIDDERVRVYGSTAVVTFRPTVAGTIDGRDVSSQRRVTNVLVKADGRWRAVAQHSTLIDRRTP